MSRLSFGSLRVHLILLVVLAIGPFLGLTVISTLRQRQLAADDVHRDALRLARLAALEEEHLIDGTRQFLIVLSHFPQVQRGDAVASSALFADLLKDYRRYANIGAVKPDGEVFASALPLQGPVNLADREWFRQAMQTHRFAIGNYQIGRITRRPTVNFGYPILDPSGRTQAVLFAALDLIWLSQLESEVPKQLSPGATLTKVDDEGIILACYPAKRLQVGQSVPEWPLSKILRSQGQEVIEARGLDGVRRVYAAAPVYSDLFSGKIYVFLGIPQSEAFAEADQQLWRDLIALGIVTSLALFAAREGGNRLLLRPIQALVSATRRLAAGDLGTRTGLGVGQGELRELARAFDDMAAALEAREAQHHQAEARLRESEARYRSIVDTANEGIWIIDADGKTTFANQKMAEMLGYTVEEMMGMPLFVFMDNEGQAQVYIERCRRGMAEQHEFRFRRKDRADLWTIIGTNPIFDEEGRYAGALAMVTDITARKHTEEARALLTLAVEQAAEAIVITATDGTIQYVNPAFEHITGYRWDEVLGENPRILKSGKQDEDFYRDLWAALARGETWSGHFINKRKDGTLYEEEAVISPVWDAAGQVVNYVAVKRDVTQERHLEEQLRQAQRMEAVGRLAGGVAHDFNNLLTVIMGNAELLLMQLDPDHPDYQKLQIIDKTAEQAGPSDPATAGFQPQTDITAPGDRSQYRGGRHRKDAAAPDRRGHRAGDSPGSGAGKDRSGYGPDRAGDLKPGGQRPRCHAPGRQAHHRNRQCRTG